MKAAASHLWGDTSLEGRHVAISGVGKVGSNLVRHLVEERARVTVADVDEAAVKRVATTFGVDAAAVEDIAATPCDIFSPCAMGGALSADTIPRLSCAAVVGSANNQLREPDDAGRLRDAGVLYAPDFIVNAGGVINIAEELRGYHRERAYANVRRIFDTTAEVLATADRDGITTAAAADRLAERRLSDVGRVQLLRTHFER
jgi:valine dehydrogenase (NAD+)